MSDMRYALKFSDERDPFVFHGDGLDQAWPIVRKVLAGWTDLDPAHAELAKLPVITRDQWAGPVGEQKPVGPFDLAYMIVNWLRLVVLNDRPGRLCVHAGGVVWNESRAVLFAGPGMAGKSTVSAMLASRGLRCIGDDRVFIDGAENAEPVAVGFGLAQKVRLPLPDHIPPAMRNGIESRKSDLDGDMTVLEWDEQTQVRAGGQAPLKEIWILNREPGTEFKIERMRAGQAVRYLAELSEIAGDDLPRLLHALTGLTETVPVRYVTYSDSLDVVSELEKL